MNEVDLVLNSCSFFLLPCVYSLTGITNIPYSSNIVTKCIRWIYSQDVCMYVLVTLRNVDHACRNVVNFWLATQVLLATRMVQDSRLEHLHVELSSECS